MAEKVIWGMGYRTRIAEYKHKVVFQEKQVVSDGMGPGGNIVWKDTAIETYAAIWPLKSSERIESMKEEHEITHKIRVRYDSGVKPTMRIKRLLDNRLYDIGSMINLDEANLELEFLAKEISA